MRRVRIFFFAGCRPGKSMGHMIRPEFVRFRVVICPAEAADIAAITAIYGHHVLRGTASFEIEPPAQAEMERRRSALAAQGYPYLVAAGRGKVLGYAYAGPYRPRMAYGNTVEDFDLCPARRDPFRARVAAAVRADCGLRGGGLPAEDRGGGGQRERGLDPIARAAWISAGRDTAFGWLQARTLAGFSAASAGPGRGGWGGPTGAEFEKG